MAVHVDPLLPVHPLTADDVEAMVGVGILGEDDHVQLLDGVLVEMSPQGPRHARAIRELAALAFPVATAAGLQLSVQAPLALADRRNLPEPDVAIVREPERDRHPSCAALVVEMGATSLAMDLGTKARIYAAAGIPEFWVLDVEHPALHVHTDPGAGGYATIARHDEDATVTATQLPLTLRVGALL